MKHDYDETARSLGKAVRQFRCERGWSQWRLAEVCNLDLSYISLLERAKRSPRLSTLGRICDGLGISLSQLFRTAAALVNEARVPAPSNVGGHSTP